jgi:ABC-type transport system involved in cytochrome bd biosynthesis fused ATPase/permease subunit
MLVGLRCGQSMEQEETNMLETDKALIKLEGVTKVFYTDEVETHALSGIHLEIKEGEYLAIAETSKIVVLSRRRTDTCILSPR